MQAHGAVKVFELHVHERADLDDAGVIDEDVELAEMLESLLHGGVDLSGLELIAFDREDFSAEVIQVIFGSSELIRIARKESDLSSSLANLACNF